MSYLNDVFDIRADIHRVMEAASTPAPTSKDDSKSSDSQDDDKK